MGVASTTPILPGASLRAVRLFFYHVALWSDQKGLYTVHSEVINKETVLVSPLNSCNYFKTTHWKQNYEHVAKPGRFQHQDDRNIDKSTRFPLSYKLYFVPRLYRFVSPRKYFGGHRVSIKINRVSSIMAHPYVNFWSRVWMFELSEYTILALNCFQYWSFRHQKSPSSKSCWRSTV